MSETSIPRPRCMYLYCKAMAVYGEAFESDPEYQAGMTEFTCLRTQKNLGPDDGDVSLELCSDPQRSCFQEY
ncbi:MAG: hypothetical protein NZ700_08010 [Gemmataceae bacterium]|nr:hypothetical protein [Gemmataceae bacterium]MDW8266504.1 hypothetical protein [Gemmataceae bacterium]